MKYGITAERWDEDQAQRYIEDVQEVMADIAANPRRGRLVEPSEDGIFRAPANSHVVFYKISRGRVLIVRILHQRMDFRRHI